MARSISSLVVAAAVLTFVFSPAREALADWFVEAMRPGEAQEQSVADESTAPVPTKAAPSASRRGVAGTWVGSYRCRSKAAAGRLVIERVRGSRDEFRGVLHFGPTADDPATRRGSFRLRGTLDGRLLELKPTTWIEQPAGYISIGFRSMIPPGRFSLLEGDVTGGNCTTFSFSRR